LGYIPIFTIAFAWITIEDEKLKNPISWLLRSKIHQATVMEAYLNQKSPLSWDDFWRGARGYRTPL